MDTLPQEIVQEIIVFSVDYQSFTSIRNSLSCLRCISKKWRAMIEAVIPKISQLVQIDIEIPVEYLTVDSHSHFWRASVYMPAPNQMMTSNYFMIFDARFIKIYHKSLANQPQLYHAMSILTSSSIRSFNETTVGLMLGLRSSTDHSFVVLPPPKTGETVELRTENIFTVHSSDDIDVLYHCLLITDSVGKIRAIEHMTMKQLLMPDWTDFRIINHCHYSLLWLDFNCNSAPHLYDIIAKVPLMRGKADIHARNNFTDDAVLINGFIYHLPSNNTVIHKYINPYKLLSLYKDDNRYKAILSNTLTIQELTSV